MKKVALYCRVSTELQMNEKTIDSQISELVDYCKKNQLVVFEKYKDDGYSGEMLARPDLDRLRDDAKTDKFDAVLLHAVDRLSRNHIHAGLVIEELQKNGKEVIFLNAPPTNTPEGRLLFDIQSVVAQYEKEKIKERTRRGRLFKARKGIIVGNTPPYGYRYVKRDGIGIYEVNKEEADVVREIFDLYVNKLGTVRKVSKWLYDKGIVAPKGGSKWGNSTLFRIVTNESYTGITHYHKSLSYEPLKPKTDSYKRVKNTGRRLRPKEEWIPIQIPSIIEKDLYNKAQMKKVNNSALSLRNTKHPYLLARLVEHSPCGYKMGGNVSHGYAYYRCTERARSFPIPKSCRGVIQSDYLDGIVWESLTSLITNPRPLLNYLKSKRNNSSEMISRVNKELEDIQSSLDKVKHKEDGLASNYSEGVLNTDQIATLMNGLNDRRKMLTDKQYEKQNELELLNNSTRATPMDVKEIFSKLRAHIKTLNFEQKQAVVRLIVDKVIIDKQKAVVNLNLESPKSPYFYKFKSEDGSFCVPNLEKEWSPRERSTSKSMI